MFLIDKTGSMADDINEVKKSMGMIMDYVSKFNNVKIGLAFYGDKNYHHQFWYNKTQLTSNIKEIRKLIDNFSIIGNPDTPESVNDAIVKTVEETNWTPGNRRLMLVIGDAVSQEPPLSSYTKKQVIQKCDSMNVKFNLYPIILGANQFHFSDPKSINKTFAKVFPNPANSYCEIDFNKEGFYYCELNDITGKKIISSTANKTNMNLNLSGIPSGTYLLQVYDNTLSSYYSTPLIIQH